MIKKKKSQEKKSNDKKKKSSSLCYSPNMFLQRCIMVNSVKEAV